MEKVFLCLDFGTESVRGELIDSLGTSFPGHVSKYRTFFGDQGFVEQEPDELYLAMLIVCKALVKQAHELRREIEAICVDSTACSLLFLDNDYLPLDRIMLWMDVRSDSLVNNYHLDQRFMAFHRGGSIQATWMPLKVRWMKEFKPDIYKKTAFVCELLNWIEYKLTNRLVTSKNIATLKWYYGSLSENTWPQELYETLDIADVLEKVVSEVVPTGKVIGYLDKGTARSIGLSSTPLVIEGGADAFVGMIGLAAAKDGDVALIGGSSHVMLAQTKDTINIEGLYGAFPNALIPGLNVIEGSQTATGATLKWYVDNFFPSGQQDYAALDRMAEQIPAGSEGLVVLDHWQGNRSPFMDASSRGVIRGLSFKHSPIHVYRAIMEGVALGTSVIFKHLIAGGYKVNTLTIGGGIAKSRLWTQIHADALGIPLNISEIGNAPLLGCAIYTAVACGYYSTIEEAVATMCPKPSTIYPDLDKTKIYSQMENVYESTYWSLYG